MPYNISDIINKGLTDYYTNSKQAKPKGKQESTATSEGLDSGIKAVIQKTSATPEQHYEIPQAKMETGVGDALLSGLALQSLGGLQNNPMESYARLAFDRYQTEQQRLAAAKHQFGTPEQTNEYLGLDLTKQQREQNTAGMDEYQEKKLEIERKAMESDAEYKRRMADAAVGKVEGNDFDAMFKDLSDNSPFMGLENDNPQMLRGLAVSLGLGDMPEGDKKQSLYGFNEKLNKSAKYKGAFITHDGNQYVLKYQGNKKDMNSHTKDLFREFASAGPKYKIANIPSKTGNRLQGTFKK